MTFISNVNSVISFAGRAVSSFIAGNHHRMGNHVFSPGAYGSSRLYYQGDVPILELLADDPYEAGKSHGYLMGKALQKLFEQLNLFHLITHQQPKDVARTLTAIRRKIPKKYLDEMKGIVDGFNSWRHEHNWLDRREITLDELLLLHLMPDQCHFSPKEMESILKKRAKGGAMACTAVIARDKEKGIIFGRNLDWPNPYGGVLGTMSFVINRKYSSSQIHDTVEVGFPGLVGTLTGMNDSGFSLAMNVCAGDTQSIQGMPAVFFNRMCLETVAKVDQVAELLKKHPPLGSYHLTVADKTKGQSIHLFQRETGTNPHVVRKMTEDLPLITTNCRHPSTTRTTHDMNDSVKRTRLITALFKKAMHKKSIAELVKESLTLDPVNCDMTIHKIVMYPQSKTLCVAFDNQFAASVPLHRIDTKALFAF